MSNNHVGEIVFSIGESGRGDVTVENFQYSLDNVNWQALSEEKKEETVEAKLGIGKNGEEVTGEVGVGKSAFYDGRSYYHTYFVPFNSDKNKSLFVKYDCNGKHFEREFKPEGNMNNLKYDLVHYNENISISEYRGIVIIAKNEDLERRCEKVGRGYPVVYLSGKNSSIGPSDIAESYVYVKKGGNYRGYMSWYSLSSYANWGELRLVTAPMVSAITVVNNIDELKEKSPAILYTNDGKPKIEEIEWKGLEETINDLEARDKSKQEKAENEINNQSQQQIAPEDSSNPIEEIPKKDINSDPTQKESSAEQPQNIDNDEKEDIRTEQEQKNKDEMNVPAEILSNSIQSQITPEDSNNPTEKIINININPDSTQTEQSAVSEQPQNIDNDEKEDIRTEQEQKNKDEMNVPAEILSNSIQSQTMLEDNNNPISETPKEDISPDPTQKEISVAPEQPQNIDNGEKEDIQTKQKTKSKDELNVPTDMLSNSIQSQITLEDNNPAEEIPNVNITPDSTQIEPPAVPEQKQNINANALENTQPQQESKTSNITPEEPEKQDTKKGFFARNWESIKNFFRAIFRFFGAKVGEKTESPVSVPEQNPQPKTQSEEPQSLYKKMDKAKGEVNAEINNDGTERPANMLADDNTQQKTNSTVNTIDNTSTTI